MKVRSESRSRQIKRSLVLWNEHFVRKKTALEEYRNDSLGLKVGRGNEKLLVIPYTKVKVCFRARGLQALDKRV